LVKILIIGMGEIGKALFEVLKKYHNDVYAKDKETIDPIKADVLHICYPYSKDFHPITNDYIKEHNPRLVFIHSTVPVGTTHELNISLYHIYSGALLIHAPIRGQHDNLAKGIQEYTMMVGTDDRKESFEACGYLAKANINTYSVVPASTSELAKLLSLTQYGVNIEFARYAKKCCDYYGVHYQPIKNYTKTYNDLLTKVAGEEIGANHKKFNLDPPTGKIGGHCVLQAMRKLNAQVPEKFISRLIEINDELAK